MAMQRFYEQSGEYVTLEKLLDHLWDHPLTDERRLPLLIWGSMGVGKCTAYESSVKANGLLMQIGDLVARYAGDEKPDGEGYWSRPTEPLTVSSLDAKGRLVLGRVERLYRQHVQERGRRVRLDDGSSITMTQQHRLMGVDDWQREIRVGDRVCVPAHDALHTGSPIASDLTTLLAWQVAEGYEEGGMTAITQSDGMVLERVRDAARSFAAREGIEMNSMPLYPATIHKSGATLCITSIAYRNYLIDRGYQWGKRSAEKRIPDFIVSADDATVRLFLREFLAGEGHANPKGYVEVASASEFLMRQLSLMFRRFGIWLRFAKRMKRATNGLGVSRPYWCGVISGNSLQRLQQHVGIACPRKQAALDAMPIKTANTNTEGIPISDLLAAVLTLTGLPCKRFGIHQVYYTGTQEASRAVATQALAAIKTVLDGSMLADFEASSFASQNHPSAHQIRNAFANLDRERLQSEIIDPLTARLQREVFYARVVEVEDVWLDEWVYDLEIAEHHNYVAGGMITHNTQQIKAYAKARGRKLTTYHPAHDTTGADIVGKPIVDEVSGVTKYAVPGFLPNEGDPDGILFVDELNRAPELVLAGLMEVFGEGTISQSNWELPKNWQMVAAANPSELGYQVNELDQAMVDRMLHYAPGWDAPAWAKWAQSTGKFKPQVIDFAMTNTNLIETGEAQLPLEIENKLKATPRSLEYFNALYETDLSEGMLRVITQGILGREVAEEFLRQHLGERPLSFKALLEGSYDPILERWTNAGDESLISATTKKMVAALVGRTVDERVAQRLGRYLAMIPAPMRDEAWSLLQRSSTDWLDPLKQTSAKWRQHLAKQNLLMGGG